jgi:hypothetical protein
MSQSGILKVDNAILPPDVATSYDTDAGTAVPSSNEININGGPGVTVSANPNGSNNILISVSGEGFKWNNQTTDLNPVVVENGYAANKPGSTLQLTLPTGAAFGSVVKVMGVGFRGWQLNAGTGQSIIFGSSETSSGGYLASTNQYDQVTVVCSPSSLIWIVDSAVGNLTVM